jgi:hypothetical protein
VGGRNPTSTSRPTIAASASLNASHVRHAPVIAGGPRTTVRRHGSCRAPPAGLRC